MASARRRAARPRQPDGAREFAAYVDGAAPRLLRTAALLTGEAGQTTGGEPIAPLALALLRRALARTYAVWDRLERTDPYDHTRAELLALFLRSSWYRRRRGRGPLAALPARVRLVLVLRLYEGVAEEQAAALLGLSVDRVRLLCARGVHLVLHPPASGAAP
ncbi:siderophore-interacting protein [Streptomyces sp. NPDC088923]|uniref:siderophore-interacting protein n=1 Tax=Streptomyces sp. NPDC088923 TaxID=3365913 RepID=UPI00381666EE